MVGNSTHTARTNAEAYANTTIDTKYKACNKQEGHFSLSLTVHEKKTCEITILRPLVVLLIRLADWLNECLTE